MKPARAVRRQLLGWGAAALGIVALALMRTLSTPTPTEAAARLPVLRDVPAFALTDQAGQSVSADALQGRVWVANFIFTSCPGQCLLMTDQFRHLQRALDDVPVAFVSFTVDPAHDTPEVLAAYAARHGGDPRWRLLTGPRAAIESLCRDGFGLAVDAAPPGAREPITHSVRFLLVDAAGRLRGAYDSTDGAAMARLRRDLRTLLEPSA